MTDLIEIYACAAICVEGRIQAASRKHLKSKDMRQHLGLERGIDWVDIVSQPGMNKFLAESNVHLSWFWLTVYCLTLQLRKVYQFIILMNIRKNIGISVLIHGAKVVAIVGHPQCAANDGDRQKQMEQLRKAKKVVLSFGFEVPIILLWVREDWKTVDVIDDNGTVSVHSYNVYTASKQ